jgi:hypothetical protein
MREINWFTKIIDSLTWKVVEKLLGEWKAEQFRNIVKTALN